jgi:hypothetical protein
MRGVGSHRAALVLVLVLAAMDAAAEERNMKLREAVDQVQRDTGGKILAAQTVGHGSNRTYRIKVLTTDGRVRVVQVPARSNESTGGR